MRLAPEMLDLVGRAAFQIAGKYIIGHRPDHIWAKAGAINLANTGDSTGGAQYDKNKVATAKAGGWVLHNQDVSGLKAIMLRDLGQFSRNLTTKLLTYATGRTMDVGDRAEIDRIAKKALAPGTGMKDLIKEVATSQLFLTK